MNLIAATDERDDARDIAAFDVTGHRDVQICDTRLVEFVGNHRLALMPFPVRVGVDVSPFTMFS